MAVPRTPVTEQMIEEERESWRRIAGDRVPPSTYLEVLDRFDVPDSIGYISDISKDMISVLGSGPLGEPVVHVHAIHKARGGG